MSGICGWIGGGLRAAAVEQTLERMAAQLSVHDNSAVWTSAPGQAAVGVAALRGDPERFEDEGCLVVVEGMAYWSDPALAIRAGEKGLAESVAAAYRERGERFLESLHGTFGVAVLSRDGSRALLAADRIGVRPLYFSQRADGLLFGTTLDALLAHPAGPAEIDPQAIYDYVYFSHVPAPRTGRRGCRRLLPGELIRFEDGRAELGRFWEVEYDDHAPARFEPLAEEFHALLRDGVRNTLAEGVGAFLSGGTDSSTVAGILSEVSDPPTRTFSIGFKAEGFDETGYATIASKRFGTEQHVYYVTPEDVVAAVPHIAAAYPDPFGNESAVPSYYCAKFARDHGVTRMLAGDGGDELFAGNTRYAKEHVFARYGWIPAWLRRGLIEPALSNFPAGDRIWPVRKARSYVRQANTPMPDRMGSWNLLERFGPPNVFEPGFLEQVDTGEPLRLQREIYGAARAKTMLNRMLAFDLKFTLADNDLVKVGRMCELAGLEVAFPLLSDEMVAFSARVPASLKLKPFRLRYFFKHALRDYLPVEILKKSKHGFGLPFGIWLGSHQGLRDLAADSLAGLRTRGIVRPEFLDELDQVHRDGAANYYGVMIWHFLMLEQWFRAHVDSKASGS